MLGLHTRLTVGGYSCRSGVSWCWWWLTAGNIKLVKVIAWWLWIWCYRQNKMHALHCKPEGLQASEMLNNYDYISKITIHLDVSGGYQAYWFYNHLIINGPWQLDLVYSEMPTDYTVVTSNVKDCKTRCLAVARRTARCRYNFRHNGIVHAVTLVQHGFLV